MHTLPVPDGFQLPLSLTSPWSKCSFNTDISVLNCRRWLIQERLSEKRRCLGDQLCLVIQKIPPKAFLVCNSQWFLHVFSNSLSHPNPWHVKSALSLSLLRSLSHTHTPSHCAITQLLFTLKNPKEPPVYKSQISDITIDFSRFSEVNLMKQKLRLRDCSQRIGTKQRHIYLSDFSSRLWKWHVNRNGRQ